MDFDPHMEMARLKAKHIKLGIKIAELTRQLHRRARDKADVEEEMADLRVMIALEEGRQAA
jgi:hypothetical protein